MRWIYALAALGASTLFWVNDSSATDLSSTYSVTHSFTFAPSGGAPVLPVYDFGASTTALPGGSPDVNNGSAIFDAGGGTFSEEATSTGPLSNAIVDSSATLSPFALGGPVSGIIRSSGQIVAVTGGSCCAISRAALVFGGPRGVEGGPAANGRVEYATSEVSSTNTTVFNDGDLQMSDPIDFKVTDLKTGDVTLGSLFSVSSHMQGAGSFSWGSGTFALDANNFDFSMRIDSPYTVQQGTADLQVVNGFITVSDGTGMFAGLFPAVGKPGDFSIPFDTNFSLDYNLGNFNGDPLAVQFTLGNSGSACAVPEPSTWAIVLVGLGAIGVAKTRRRRRRPVSQLA